MSKIEIETPRLLLRRWKDADLNDFIKMNSDPDVMKYFPEAYGAERTIKLYKIIQDEFSKYGYGLYAVEEKSSNKFIGFVGFHWADFDADFCPCIEIGWRLKKEYWHKGYATEGAIACMKHGFTNLGFDKVYSFTAVENTPSQRVMKRIGMQLYQYFEHPEVAEGHFLKPHVCYTINKNIFCNCES